MRAAIPYEPAVAGDIRALTQSFDIPLYIVRQWQLEGFLSRSVVTEAEWELLNLVRCCIWGNRNVIRAMLRKLPVSERRRLIDACEKTAIERIVYVDFLRFKLSGTGIMGDAWPVTFERYQKYLTWRHPNLYSLLTYNIFIKQRKAALAKIAYARKTGTLEQLARDLCHRDKDN